MRRHQTFLATTIAGLSLLVAACGGPATATTAPASAPAAVVSVSTPSTSSNAVVVATPTAATTTTGSVAAAAPTTGPTVAASQTAPTSATTSSATPTASAATTSSSTTQSASTSAMRYDVIANGSKATYSVREQLVRLSAPSEAVGTTTSVTGDIVIGADGKVDSGQSKLVVDLTSLQSESGMRDRFIQGNTLDTAQYPTATFVPTAIAGLSSPLPTSGQQTFQLTGNLTIHGVTKPVTFTVTTRANGSTVTGQATTDLKFEDFGMTAPKAGAVLSVVDDVRLAITLNLTRSA